MRLPLPRRRILRAAIYIVSSLLVLIAADLILMEERRIIHPGFDTTRILAPTLPDGSIDYLAAIEQEFGQGVTPENNAAIPILQALGRSALSKTQPTDGITDRLGMAHLPEKGDYFVSYADYLTAHPSPDADDHAPYFQSDDLSLPVSIKPYARQWIQSNEAPFAILAEAAKRSRFFIPYNGGSRPELLAEVLLPHAMVLNQSGTAVIARSMIRLENSDLTGCLADTATVHHLARLLGQAPSFIEKLVAAKLERMACRAEQLAAATGKLTAQQDRALAENLLAMGDLPPFTESLNAERYFAIDFIQALARRSPWESGALFDEIFDTPNHPNRSASPLVGFLPIPFEASMRAMNHFHDSEIAIAQLHSYAERVAANHLLQSEVTSNASPFPLSLLGTDWVAQALLPSVGRIIDGSESTKTARTLTRLALALAAFKSEHGNYPAALAELVPSELDSIPNDLFTDQPYIYSCTDAGYRLYSVGPNMKDDSGIPVKTDDIVVAVP